MECKEHRTSSPLNPDALELFPLLDGIKNKIANESSKTDEELLKEIQQMISSQHKFATAITLAQPEVPKLKGDPMEFKTFVMAFDACVQSKVISSTDRFYYLDQHLEGEPKELISSCLHIEPKEGYKEAQRMLEKDYGDPYKASTTYMQKLSSWPNLRYDDSPALKRLSIFVNTCNNAMKTIQHLAVLNHPTNMQTTVQKLPAGLQTKWHENVVRTRS